MKTDKIIDVIGMIDEEFVEEARTPVVRRKNRLVPLAVGAAAVFCVAAPLPVMTAMGSDGAYRMLYMAAPSVAQSLKPVQEVCISNGVRMEVISADIKGDSAAFCIAMTDVDGVGLDATADLDDSDWFNTGRDTVGHTSFHGFDEETKTAYFLTEMRTMDGSDYEGGKVTFGINDLIFGRAEGEFSFAGIDLADVPFEPKTCDPAIVSGGESPYTSPEEKHDPDHDWWADYRILPQSTTPLATVFDDVSITNVGYFDGALHVQTYFEDVFGKSKNGHCFLADENGEKLSFSGNEYYAYMSYWADGSYGRPINGVNNEYLEFVFPVEYENLPKYSLGGEFFRYGERIDGNWQVTFKLS